MQLHRATTSSRRRPNKLKFQEKKNWILEVADNYPKTNQPKLEQENSTENESSKAAKWRRMHLGRPSGKTLDFGENEIAQTQLALRLHPLRSAPAPRSHAPSNSNLFPPMVEQRIGNGRTGRTLAVITDIRGQQAPWNGVSPRPAASGVAAVDCCGDHGDRAEEKANLHAEAEAVVVVVGDEREANTVRASMYVFCKYLFPIKFAKKSKEKIIYSSIYFF